MKIETTRLKDVLMIAPPPRFGDHRGFFSESWNKSKLTAAGVYLPEFVQDNHSISSQTGTVRGLHFQSPPHAQGKLLRCGRGRIFDVAVDIRNGSPTYGDWFGTELSFDNGVQLWILAGFLHAFMTLEPDSEINYKAPTITHLNAMARSVGTAAASNGRWTVSPPQFRKRTQTHRRLTPVTAHLPLRNRCTFCAWFTLGFLVGDPNFNRYDRRSFSTNPG